MAIVATVDKKFPVCGHISDVVYRLKNEVAERHKSSGWEIQIATPFGIVRCIHYSDSQWVIRSSISYATLYMYNKKVPGLLFYKKTPEDPRKLSAHVPYGALTNPKYKFRKPRKSTAQVQGLDLRRLQQEYRRKLGDMARFSMLLREMRAIGLNTLVQSSFDVPLAKLLLKQQYEYRKAEIIALHKRGVVTKYTTEAYKGDV